MVWGSIFELPQGSHTIVTLATFGYFGGASPDSLIIDSNGNLFGTTWAGGDYGNGTVFSLHTDGTGFTNLYSFTSSSGSPATNSDGANPSARLILSGNTLYGSAKGGG